MACSPGAIGRCTAVGSFNSGLPGNPSGARWRSSGMRRLPPRVTHTQHDRGLATHFVPTPAWLGDTVVLGLGQIVGQAMAVGVGILIASAMTVEAWGRFATLWATASLIAILVEFGVVPRTLRGLSAVYESRVDDSLAVPRAGQTLVAEALGVLLWVGIPVAALAAGIGFAVLETVSQGLTLTLLALFGMANATAATLESPFRARRDLARIVTVLVGEKALALVLVYVSMRSAMLPVIASALLVPVAVRVALLYALMRRRPYRLALRCMRPSLAVLRTSLSFLSVRASLSVIPRLDVPIVGFFSISAAGYLALGERALAPGLLAAATAGATLFPHIANRRVRSPWVRAGLFGAAIALAGAMLLPTIIDAFLPQYREGTALLQLLFVSLPFVFISNSLLPSLYVHGRERETGRKLAYASCLSLIAMALAAACAPTVGVSVIFVLRQVIFAGLLLGIANRS